MIVLLLCHLFIGALIGFAIYRWKGEALAVPVAMVAAILPDLVDKPLGHLFLQNTLDNGRIFAHSLLFLGIVACIAGVVAWKQYRPLAVALLAGVVSHLLLDGMWDNPTTLFWPLLGPFAQDHYPDYFGNAIVSELTAPSEYAFLLGIGVIAAAVLYERLGPRLRSIGDALLRNRRIVYGAMMIIGIVQLVTAFVTLANDPAVAQNEFVLAVALMLGGASLVRLDPGSAVPDASSS